MGATALTAAPPAQQPPLAAVPLLPAAPMSLRRAVRALPGAVVAFAAALAPGAPTRTSAQPCPPTLCDSGPRFEEHRVRAAIAGYGHNDLLFSAAVGDGSSCYASGPTA